MKTILKKIIPAWLLKEYRKSKRYKKMKFPAIENRTTSEIFNEIYTHNFWESSESSSGPGSEITQTGTLIKALEKLLQDLNVSTVLDIPCGDFNWMQKVDLSKRAYIGADIVEEIVLRNQEQFKERKNLTFKVLDLMADPLPKSDILIIRDCLVHFSYEDIFKAISNIKSSGCQYLLASTFPEHPKNKDIRTGDWRTLNLQAAPFNFPDPLRVINENCTEGDGTFKDKSMALWEIREI